MSFEHLSTYLNDHLAGSVVATELLAHLERAHAGTPLARFCADLAADITDDRRQLETLMSGLHIVQSPARQAAAWLSEKMTRVKLLLEDRAGGPLHLLEALDGVRIGIDGKLALWKGLAEASTASPSLKSLDYDHLARRAEEQRDRLEIERLKAAAAALSL